MSLPYKNKKSPYWQIAPTINGVQKFISTKSKDYNVALTMVRKLEGQIAEGEPIADDKVLFSELAARLLQYQRNKGEATVADTERRLNKHILPKLGHYRAAAIARSKLIANYIADRLSEGAKPGGIQKELAHIRTAYRLATQNGEGFVIPYMPVLEGEVREGRYTETQYQLLLKHSNPTLKIVLQLAYWTGWRHKSILKLRWSQIDLEGRFMWLNAKASSSGEGGTKNKRPTRLYLHDELFALIEGLWIETERLQRENEMIIPWVIHRDGKQVKSIRTAFDFARERSGLTNHIIHDFRRTTVRALGDNGVSTADIMEMVGFKTTAMVVRYMAGASDERLQQIGEQLAKKRARKIQ